MYLDASRGSKKMACLLNANNKGYCRVKLDPDHMLYFREVLQKIDTMNRCYLMRVLYDQVRMRNLAPD